MSTSRRVLAGLAALAALAVVLNLVGLIADRFGGAEVVPGPDGSSHVTTAGGWAAFHDLLEAEHPVTLLEGPIRPGTLDPTTTLIIASPDSFVLDERQVDLIARFLDDGGRLVLASTSFFGDLATTLLDPPPVLGSVPEGEMMPFLAVAETAGVTSLSTSGLYAWSDTGAALPVVGRDGAAVVAVASIGAGRLVVLADPAILSNAHIGAADNAAFALAVVGGPGRPVVFNEYVHGYGGDSAIQAIPRDWRAAILLGIGAVLVWLWSIGSRFAPAEPADRTFPPDRALYVDALAASLARSPDGIAPALREALRTLGIEAPPTDDPVELGRVLAASRASTSTSTSTKSRPR